MGADVRQDGSPDHFIHTIVGRESVTTGGASVPTTGACPTGANCAIVTAVDAALIVTSAAVPVAAPALGVDVEIGGQAYIAATAGTTKIAGIER